MAMLHLSVDRIVKGKGEGGATGFAQYIAREQADRATQHARYLTRESHPARDDLVAAGFAFLPGWANDATHFFTMADRYERQGGIIARTYEIALPRELSQPEQQDLVDDMRSSFFTRHPHAWAIHCPQARDGGEQPHVHIMVNERVLDGVERHPKHFFARAAPRDQDPAGGGARKELSWNRTERLQELRAGIAILVNAALERAGVESAVSPETLKARGHDRAPEHDQGNKARYLHARHGIETQGWRETLAQRTILHHEYHPWENDLNLAAWHEQKQREGVRDVSREAMIDHVRDRFWRHDHSPAREEERAQSFNRALDREWARTQRPLWHRQSDGIEHTQARQRSLNGRLVVDGNEDRMHGGVHVHLETHEREVAHG
jgi:MobA/MobL family